MPGNITEQGIKCRSWLTTYPQTIRPVPATIVAKGDARFSICWILTRMKSGDMGATGKWPLTFRPQVLDDNCSDIHKT